MNDYENCAPAEVEEPPDPRVIALHRVIDLEQQHASIARQAEEYQKRLAIVREEMSEARDALNGTLGLPSKSSVSVGMNTVKRTRLSDGSEW